MHISIHINQNFHFEILKIIKNLMPNLKILFPGLYESVFFHGKSDIIISVCACMLANAGKHLYLYVYNIALLHCGFKKKQIKIEVPQAFLIAQMIHANKKSLTGKLLIKAYFSLKKNSIMLVSFGITSSSHNPFIFFSSVKHRQI